MTRRVIYFCHLSRVCAITRRCLSGRITPWGLLHPGGAQPHPWIGEPRLHTAFYVPLVESNLSAVVYLRHAAFSVRTPDGFMVFFFYVADQANEGIIACSFASRQPIYCIVRLIKSSVVPGTRYWFSRRVRPSFCLLMPYSSVYTHPPHE